MWIVCRNACAHSAARPGAGERDHEPVALDFDFEPAVLADLVADDRVVGAEELEPPLIPKPRVELS